MAAFCQFRYCGQNILGKLNMVLRVTLRGLGDRVGEEAAAEGDRGRTDDGPSEGSFGNGCAGSGTHKWRGLHEVGALEEP